MIECTSFRSFQVIIQKYIKEINSGERLEKQLKDLLIYIHNLNYTKQSVNNLDLRKKKDKNELLFSANRFLKSKLISKIGLSQRGWTKELIDIYLNKPDLFEINPQTRRYLYLYSLYKVEYLESLESIKPNLDLSISTKPIEEVGDVYQWIEELNIDIPIIPIETLLKKSIELYNKEIAITPADKKSLYNKAHILQTLCLNYLRHKCTRYDSYLNYLNLQFNTELSCIRVKEYINKKINQTYPNLKGNIYQYQKNNGFLK